MKPQDMAYSDMNEMVFEQRNKDYGAFRLRKMYRRHIMVALLVSIGIFALVMGLPWIMNALKGPETVVELPARIVSITDLAPPPPIEDVAPPPPPEFKLPAPPQETIKFLPPKVTEKEVPEEEEMPTIAEVKNAPVIGTETIEGPGEVVFEEPPAEITSTKESEPAIFTVVEQMPEFPGGEKALFEFLGKHTRYPASAENLGIQGTVYTSFVIDANGKISHIEVQRGISKDCDKEAIRVIESMPDWKPGKQGGRPVAVRFVLPFRFKLGS